MGEIDRTVVIAEQRTVDPAAERVTDRGEWSFGAIAFETIIRGSFRAGDAIERAVPIEHFRRVEIRGMFAGEHVAHKNLLDQIGRTEAIPAGNVAIIRSVVLHYKRIPGGEFVPAPVREPDRITVCECGNGQGKKQNHDHQTNGYFFQNFSYL